eukprot:TRINITY_DN182_c0_g2_i3.p1 TRINITY_DN182_c0_g2~~TRINITY_DN182_c0_g2_i3.p1  ORF type:complete len:448 (-),score=60.74 TRINITY_DN182_c0_g2_i3:269-1612(-)
MDNNNNNNNRSDDEDDNGDYEEIVLDTRIQSRLRRYMIFLSQNLFGQNLQGEQSDEDEDEDMNDSESAEENNTNIPKEDLLNTPLHSEILYNTGSDPQHTNQSIYNLVKNSGFSMSNRRAQPQGLQYMGPNNSAHILQSFIPNKSSKIAHHGDHVFCGLFSKDGSKFMSACQDHRIRIYDTESWKVKKTIAARNVGWSIISTDYSPDKDWLIYSSWSDYVQLCNTSGLHEVHEPLCFKPESHRFCLFSIQFSSDSNEILGGSSDRHLYIYDVVKRERIARVKGHADDINAVAFADKSSHVFFSGGDDSLVKVWDRRMLSQAGKCAGVLAGHFEGITFIDSKGDGIYLISNGKDQTIKLWDIRVMKPDGQVPAKATKFDYRYSGLGGLRQYKKSKNDSSLMTYRGHKVYQTLIRCRFSPAYSTGQKYIYSGSYDGKVYGDLTKHFFFF